MKIMSYYYIKEIKHQKRDIGQFHGGKVEIFEKFEDAVKREIKEETDLDIDIIKLNGICDHILDRDEEDKVHWITPSYLCKVISGIAKIMEPTKHTDIGWFKLDELPENLTIPTKKALEDYLKWSNN